jgi:hypothetical protein
MFRNNKKSKKAASLADTVFDFFVKPKPKKSHKKRNAFLVVLGSAGAAALAGTLGKKQQP